MAAAEDLISLLNLEPLSVEGGFYAETYRSNEKIPDGALPARYHGSRPFGTAIYYLLTPETVSTMHRLPSDEVFHFYLGDPVQMLQLHPDGSGKVIVLGPDLLAGMRPQVVVPRGVWQGARLVHGGRFALMGTTVAPGFDCADYEAGPRADLIEKYPDFAQMIMSLTRG